MDLGAAALAITGIVTGLGALYVNWRSQKDQNIQQTVANQVVKNQAELEKTKQIVDQISQHNDRLISRAERAEHDAEALRTEAESERTMRRHALAAQEARCREVQGSLTETLVVLRAVMNDEIGRATADMALRLPMHPHEPMALPPANERGSNDRAD